MIMLKKIVIIGPESTGKSTLCEQLATHYRSEWCPEYAREYLTTNGMHYSFDDLLTIARGQLQLEDAFAATVAARVNNTGATGSSFVMPPALLFIDTDMYVMKVWCEYVFGKCHQFILDQVTTRQYDLYLLCNTDLPWAYDPLREYPDDGPRQELFQVYKDILINQQTPWSEIKGSYEARLHTAITAVDDLLRKEQGVQVSDTTTVAQRIPGPGNN